MTSDDALNMTEIPASIIIVGGGAIGVEWASMLRDFGTAVTLVEVAERLVPLEDEDVSRELQRLLSKRKINVKTSVRLLEDGITADNDGVTVEIERKTGAVETLIAERVLVSVGRSANIAGFGLERTRARTERGAIVVDGAMRTDDPHVYAVGDVVGGLQLAHVASREGAIAVERIAGLKPLLLEPLLFLYPSASTVDRKSPVSDGPSRRRLHEVSPFMRARCRSKPLAKRWSMGKLTDL